MNNIKRSFPSRVSWLRAISLISTRISLSLLLSGTIYSLPAGFTRTLLNLSGWIGFSMLMGVWSHLFFVFLGETKLWKPKQNSIREAVDGLKISLVSDLVALGFVMTCIILAYSFFAGLRDSKNPEDVETYLGIIGLLILFIWFMIVPILYQEELNKRSRSTATKKPINKPTKSTKPKTK